MTVHSLAEYMLHMSHAPPPAWQSQRVRPQLYTLLTQHHSSTSRSPGSVKHSGSAGEEQVSCACMQPPCVTTACTGHDYLMSCMHCGLHLSLVRVVAAEQKARQVGLRLQRPDLRADRRCLGDANRC